MLKNEVKLEGVRNARELGGFPVGTKVVKKDVLIRTGTLEHAKEDAIRVLNEQYRVQAIIDFRMNRLIYIFWFKEGYVMEIVHIKACLFMISKQRNGIQTDLCFQRAFSLMFLVGNWLIP